MRTKHEECDHPDYAEEDDGDGRYSVYCTVCGELLEEGRHDDT